MLNSKKRSLLTTLDNRESQYCSGCQRPLEIVWSKPLLKQGLELDAQGYVHTVSSIYKDGRLHNLSGPTVPGSPRPDTILQVWPL